MVKLIKYLVRAYYVLRFILTGKKRKVAKEPEKVEKEPEKVEKQSMTKFEVYRNKYKNIKRFNKTPSIL